MSDILAIDPGPTQSGYVVGVLCRRGHNEGTGHSVRYKSGSCVECQRENSKGRPAFSASNDAWKKRNPDKIREIRQRFYRKNRELLAAKTTAHRRKNPDKHAAYQRIYRLRNLEKHREYDRLRGRKRNRGIARLPDGTIGRIGAAQDWLCAGCLISIKKKYHIDHILPLARGGEHVESNIQLLCPTCNTSKGAKLPHEWKPRR